MLEKRLAEMVNDGIQSGLFAGAVLHISALGSCLYEQAFGYADTASGEAVTKETVFDLASVTKLFTAAMVLRLAGSGRLSLDGRLSDVLPETAAHPYISRLTVRGLLTHTSGLIAWHPFYTELPEQNLFHVLGRMEAESGNGKGTVEYSDLNYILLGEAVKRVTGLPLREAVARLISDPLKLSSVRYGPVEGNTAATEFGNQIEQRMCAERGLSFDGWRPGGIPIKGSVNDGNAYYYFGGVSGHAGLFGNAADLARFGELFVRGGEGLIAPELVRDAVTEQAPGRGLGFECSDLYPAGCGHTGFTGTALWIVPEHSLSVSLLTNRLHTAEPQNINRFRRTVFTEIYKKMGVL